MLNYALFRSAMPDSRDTLTNGIAPSVAVMRHVDPILFRIASLQQLTFSKALEFIKPDQWMDISAHGQQRIEDRWRLATIDGLPDASDAERRTVAGHWDREAGPRNLAAICTAMELLGD